MMFRTYPKSLCKKAEIKICPNCNTKLYLAYQLDFNILKCKSCGLEVAIGAGFKDGLDSLLNEEAREKALKKLRLKNFTKIINFIKYYFSNKRIHGLEVGCGYGWFLDLCDRNNIYCEGIEPESKFNKSYKENGHFVVNGLYPEVLDANIKYNFIIFNDVLEHIPDINKVMAANSQHLLLSGLLVVNIPVQRGLFHLGSIIFYHLGIISSLNRMWQFNFNSPHLYYFTKKSLTDIAQKNDLELIYTKSLAVLDISQIKNRIKQDSNIGSLKLWIFTLFAFLLIPFTKIKPDIICFFFRKNK